MARPHLRMPASIRHYATQSGDVTSLSLTNSKLSSLTQPARARPFPCRALPSSVALQATSTRDAALSTTTPLPHRMSAPLPTLALQGEQEPYALMAFMTRFVDSPACFPHSQYRGPVAVQYAHATDRCIASTLQSRYRTTEHSRDHANMTVRTLHLTDNIDLRSAQAGRRRERGGPTSSALLNVLSTIRSLSCHLD
ncbi:hypothetical protein DAEQUDRAFT_192773 [Daedalea quercina L-15889]|uniref:Uncharacterized protein n=1 Tax=Daedalea quercina L-15889 TaxID=1314783 RepID=A0A165U5I6_9APHY|nr:hypothetical protein DAEQUDRAFT_192773 [Daedalea quercina L-15889]